MSELRHPGIWTPWAEVLCYACHGPSFVRPFSRPTRTIEGGTWIELTSLQPARPDQAATTCNRCGLAIWVENEVAWLNEVAKLTAGTLHQTGGMCVGLEVPIDDDGPVVFVSAVDGPIVCAVYPSLEAVDTGDCGEQAEFEPGAITAAAAWIEQISSRFPA